MNLRVLLLMDQQHGLVTWRQAVDHGMSSDQVEVMVKSGAWVRLRRGVYVDSEAWDAADQHRDRPLLRVRAATMTLWSDFVLSHDSAALALGLGIPRSRDALVHVTRRKVHGDRQRAGVKHHLAPYLPDQVTAAEGLRVLDLARTAVDMAREHGLSAGVAACDQVLRRGVTRAELRAVADRMHCWPQSKVIRASIDLADRGAESYLESEARVLVTELGIGRPETQFGLTDAGRTVWCDLRVGRHVFEVDGRGKYDEGGRQALSAEKERQDFITGFKLGVSRVTHHDCHTGRRQAAIRLLREYGDTCDRFGTDIGDLSPYVVRRRR